MGSLRTDRISRVDKFAKRLFNGILYKICASDIAFVKTSSERLMENVLNWLNIGPIPKMDKKA